MAVVPRRVQSRPRADGLRPIVEVAAELGLDADELELWGRDKGKVDLSALEQRSTGRDGKFVSVTAITPTKAGEGKTTTAVALADGLARIGERAAACLREPSIGPVFGIKGGGTGGGFAQLAPADDINLHFTGDLHAIAAANNLLAAMLDAHLLHGNALGIDPHSITWRRCLDVNDRGLRSIVTGLGGRANGTPRETGFDITAASEVMAVLAVSRDLDDLRRRLGAITVATTVDGDPVTAEDLRAAGSMAVLLRDALKPNLVQTLEGNPALVHCGPFGNIAHGHNSLVADLLGLKLADLVIAESGFGADLGFEKLMHIVCRLGVPRPSAVVLVATVRALKHHGGDPDGGREAVRRGAENLRRHLAIVAAFGVDGIVAVNRFPSDSRRELDLVCSLAREEGACAAHVVDGFELGGAGAVDLAAAVAEAAADAPDEPPRYLYPLSAPYAEKLAAVAQEVYGAAAVDVAPAAQAKLAALESAGLGELPVCMAKTPLSIGHDVGLGTSPAGFTLPIRDVRAYTGAGWVVALCGDVQTMPGLGERPAAHRIDVDDRGLPVGLW